MRKFLPVLLLSVAACSQQGQNQAQIVYRGDQFFGINGQQQASRADSAAYASKVSFRFDDAPAVMAAPTQSVSVSRVAPPKAVAMTELAPLESKEKHSTPRQSYLPKNLFSRSETKTDAYASEGLRPAAPQSGSITLSPANGVSETVRTKVASQITEQPAASGFVWPLEGKIISAFGEKANGEHNDGINIAANLGDPIKAVSDGMVVYAGNELKGYGNMIIVRHDNGWMSAYAHADSIRVDVDDRVKQGDVIATVGKTGNVETAQLHFGLRDGKQAVDPVQYLEQSYATVR